MGYLFLILSLASEGDNSVCVDMGESTSFVDLGDSISYCLYTTLKERPL